MIDAFRLWARQAWVDGRWQHNVVLDVGSDGCFSAVVTGVSKPDDAVLLHGPVLPGMVNAHSHAFQRAFAGMAERRDSAADDFWSWRQRMYEVALRVSPEALQAVATQLYSELLRGGYTQVCEFHYLHHAPDGSRYADPLAMCRALMHAAQATGIGLTLLPVLYERAGFDQPALRPDQRRFATDTDAVLALRDGIRAAAQPLVSAGVAIHSLRAASAASISRLVHQIGADPAPIHIHIAEQTGEVNDCLAATGLRPIEWLARHVELDTRWQLVHATHASGDEIATVARSGAGVVLCPTTEANLGDGLPDLPAWMRAGAVLSLGSDSHVCRDWPQELRLLEYGQRLLLRQRNVSADPATAQNSSAARLFNACLDGGRAAAGFERWGLQAGARADFIMPHLHVPALAGIPEENLLDAWVFGGAEVPLREVVVAGRRCLLEPDHVLPWQLDFTVAMRDLWHKRSRTKARK